MICARLDVSPGDSGNTEEALAPVSGGRRGFLEEVTSQPRSEGEVGFSQVKKVGRYSRHKEELVQRPRGRRQWPILAVVSHFILDLARA